MTTDGLWLAGTVSQISAARHLWQLLKRCCATVIVIDNKEIFVRPGVFGHVVNVDALQLEGLCWLKYFDTSKIALVNDRSLASAEMQEGLATGATAALLAETDK